MQADDISYFSNIAVIAATLLGLTFVALSFFLVDLAKRYDDTALPVFRHRDRSTKDDVVWNLKSPESLTDFELLDGDPLGVCRT